MGWPGEQLLSKLWETLADKGIGSLLKPGQMRREGLATLELDRAKLLSLAQTERDAEDIRSGRKDLSDVSFELKFFKAPKVKQEQLERREPIVNIEEALYISDLNAARDSVRREINTANSVVYAEEALREDSEPPPDADVHDDWLYRWRDYTGEISEADLHKIWGRLLAGEIKAPGTYSLRTLDFLRNLSQSEALIIAKLAPVVVDGFIWRPADNVYPFTFSEMLELQEMGMIGGADSIGLDYAVVQHPENDGGWVSVLSSYERCIIIRGGSDTKGSPLRLNVMSVSKLGLQTIGLGDFKSDLQHLEKFGRYIASLGYKTTIADLVSSGSETIVWKNEVEVK